MKQKKSRKKLHREVTEEPPRGIYQEDEDDTGWVCVAVGIDGHTTTIMETNIEPLQVLGEIECDSINITSRPPEEPGLWVAKVRGWTLSDEGSIKAQGYDVVGEWQSTDYPRS